MVEAVEENRGWRAANDNSRWLVNVDSKRADNSPNSKMGRQWTKVDSEPNFKRGLRRVRTDNELNFKRVDNGPGSIWAKNKNKKKMSPLGWLSDRCTKPDRRVARMMWSLGPLLLLQKGQQRAKNPKGANNGPRLTTSQK
jgi:hypothetical protein